MKTFGRRLILLYGLLYIFPFPWASLTYGKHNFARYSEVWSHLCSSLNSRFLNLPLSSFAANLTGDSYAHYLKTFGLLGLAFILAFIWTIVRPGPEREHHLFARVAEGGVRWFLASMMLLYGAVKVYPSQFPALGPMRLVEPFGEASPLGLLWAFMGYSKAYGFLGGSIEVAAGLLLLIPRTATLGALLAMVALVNVVVVNFSYDVPVKLFSLHLLISAFVIVTLDGKRLFQFFILNREVPSRQREPLFQRKVWRWIFITLQIGFAVFLLITTGKLARENFKRRLNALADTRYYGIWRIENAPNLKPRWRRLIFELKDRIVLQLDDGRFVRYSLKSDGPSAFYLQEMDSPGVTSRIQIDRPTEGEMFVMGTLAERPVQLRLKREELTFPLLERPFHWISETPFNR